MPTFNDNRRARGLDPLPNGDVPTIGHELWPPRQGHEGGRQFFEPDGDHPERGAAPAGPFPSAQIGTDKAFVVLEAPAAVGHGAHIYTLTGQRLVLGEDRRIEVSQADARPLIVDGWKEI